MSEIDEEGQPHRRFADRKPSQAIQAVDTELRRRFARRTGLLEDFLKEWIKLEDAQAGFFGARGNNDENYLQYMLAIGDTSMALGIARMCAEFAQTTDSERTVTYLNHLDAERNDLWHYLADNLAVSETEESLELARILIQLEIDYSRKNDNDESPLARLLIPTCKWASINAMLKAKELKVAEMEGALPQQVQAQAAVKGEVLSGVFFSDIADNDARLINHLLQQALSPRAELKDKADICRVLFEYVGGKRQETVFMRLVQTDFRDTVEQSLQFLEQVAEEAHRPIAARDLQMAKAQAQVFLYKRLARRDRLFQSALTKAIQADKAVFVTSCVRTLRNEDQILTRKDAKGQSIREPVVIDKTSPAPLNACMSQLLHMDVRGNTNFHTAVLMNRMDCLRKLMQGLSMIDLYTILARLPNRYNLTIADMCSPEAAFKKLGPEVKAGRLPVEEAQQMLGTIKAIDKRMIEYLVEGIKKAEDQLNRTGGIAIAKPNFDLSKVPTIMMRQQGGAAPAAAPARPAGAAPAAGAPRPAAPAAQPVRR